MAQTIGHFQFDNLVKGRVPFLFVNLGVDTSKVYPHIFKMHLERMQMQVPEGTLTTMDPEDVVAQIQAQGKKDGDAIVVHCDDGVRSQRVGAALETAGFINVFVVDGGWQKILSSL